MKINICLWKIMEMWEYERLMNMTDLDGNFAAREVVCWGCLRRIVANIAKVVGTIAKVVAPIAKASGLLIQHQGQFLCKEACPIKLVTKCSLIL